MVNEGVLRKYSVGQGRMGAKVLGVATPSLCPNKFYDLMKTVCLIFMYLLFCVPTGVAMATPATPSNTPLL